MNTQEYLSLPRNFATIAIHSAQEPEKWEHLSVVPPIVTSTIFKHLSPAVPKLYAYGRAGNPSRNTLEECLAAIEGAKHGLCFASGLGSMTTVLGLFASGDHIICSDNLFWGTANLFDKVGKPLGLDFTFTDVTDVKEVEKCVKTNTKMIWIETPTNPTLTVIDIRAVSKIAEKHKIILAVDNTFLTPYFQRPLELGADLSVYSLTKYMNGHSDVIMGAIVLNDETLHTKLRFLQNAMGIVPSPFDSAQVNRSLKTLALRMQQHSKNALAVAKFLEGHPNVDKVLHPGLPSHPQHTLFKKQTAGHSGMVSFYIKGDLQQTKRFLQSLKVFILTESLGGYESLAEAPSIMTHASVPEDQKKKIGILDNLVRLSVGLEDVDDLIRDLNQALEIK
ncbi:cystathionine gamma-lyase-like isoform X2 [Agrilus planipennis]|uniref:cystathionine gamma-lyase n=1 Tax=Agrilus planipennis TaxID=224129 RepID=A0A1W4XAD7_AGRPL|nr:cystathionine gamma-lyase-like isoform X2 [Agrilus planipennis]